MILFQQDMWAVSALTGQGYTPEPSDLEQLIDIDSKIRLLLPAKEFLTVQSSFTNLSASQVRIQQHCLHYSSGLYGAPLTPPDTTQVCSEGWSLSVITRSAQQGIAGNIT